jgi:hypothetical protein
MKKKRIWPASASMVSFPTIENRGIPFAFPLDIVLKALNEFTMEELIMMERRRRTFTLYVDRSSQQWIVQDLEGQFWIVPGNEEDAWNHRQPFCPTDETELERIPGHYKHMLGLSA